MAEKIGRQIDVLASADDVGVVYCGLEDTNGEPIRPNPEVHGDVYWDALQIDQMHPCLTGTMLIRPPGLGGGVPAHRPRSGR